MEEFYLEKPTINKKKEILDYLLEMTKYNSRINGMGKLDEYMISGEDNFDRWLKFLEESETNGFPLRKQYLFVRKTDDRIIGMINIRINADLKNYPYGHIGYSIRPLERNKGYGKIQLMYALKELHEQGIKECLIAVKDDNIISKRIVSHFNAILKEKKEVDGKLECYYIINVDAAIGKDEAYKKMS